MSTTTKTRLLTTNEWILLTLLIYAKTLDIIVFFFAKPNDILITDVVYLIFTHDDSWMVHFIVFDYGSFGKVIDMIWK